MNAPAQIFSALAAAGVIGFFPLSGRIQEAADLEASAAKRSAAAKATAGSSAVPGLSKAANEAPQISAAASSIPPGVSAAEASAIILELSNLDGKMMTSRQLTALLDKVMSLPVTHMQEASAVCAGQKNMVYGVFLSSVLYARWGELDPDGARTHLEADKNGNPITRMVGSASLAGGWLEKDPDGFIKWAAGPEDPDNKDPKLAEMKRAMMDAVTSGIGDVDSATMERLIAASPAERRPNMILNLAQNDPDADPMDAVLRAYAEAGDDQNVRSGLNWRAGRMLAEKDPLLALQFAQEHQRPEERGGTYEATLDVWIKKDKSAAMKWLKDQPEEVQSQAVAGMRGEIKDMDYDGLAKFSADLHPKTASNVWETAVRQTSEKDPAKAVEYLENIEEGSRPGSYRELSDKWTKKDPEAASTWVDSLPQGREKDSAISGMVGQLMSKEPDASTIWASTISDPELRSAQVMQSAKKWMQRDEAAATEWIQASENLNPQQKEQLLKR